MANSSNVTLRKPANGGVDRPLSYEELDDNFLELINVINDVNTSNVSLSNASKNNILDVSKSKLDSQQFYDPGVEDVFTISGNNLVVPTSTTIFNSSLLDISTQIDVTLSDYTSGGIRAQVKGYTEDGEQIVGSTDTDFIINGSNRSFENSPSYAPVSNSAFFLSITFTQDGLDKAKYFSISVQSSGLSNLTFNRILVRG